MQADRILRGRPFECGQDVRNCRSYSTLHFETCTIRHKFDVVEVDAVGIDESVLGKKSQGHAMHLLLQLNHSDPATNQ